MQIRMCSDLEEHERKRRKERGRMKDVMIWKEGKSRWREKGKNVARKVRENKGKENRGQGRHWKEGRKERRKGGRRRVVGEGKSANRRDKGREEERE